MMDKALLIAITLLLTATISGQSQWLDFDNKMNIPLLDTKFNQNFGNSVLALRGSKYRLDNLQFHSSDEVTGDSSLYQRWVFDYGMNGDTIRFNAEEFVSIDQSWQLDHQIINIYNEEKQLVEEIELSVSFRSKILVPLDKKKHKYDAFGNLINTVYFSRDQNVNIWNIEEKSEYTYNKLVNNNEFKYKNVEMRYKYLASKNEWYLSAKNEIYFDSLNTMIRLNGYEWKEDTTWKLNLVYRFEHNSNLDLEKQTYFFYNKKYDKIVAEYQKTFEYDSNFNLIAQSFSSWDFSNGGWNPWIKEQYEYDNSISRFELLIPFALNDADMQRLFNHKIVNSIISYFDDDLDKWVDEYLGTFNYNSLDINNTDMEYEADIIIGPNPAVDYIIICNQIEHSEIQFQLFDLTGRLVFSHQSNYGDKIDLSNMVRGNYFYTIKAGNKPTINTGKLILI